MADALRHLTPPLPVRSRRGYQTQPKRLIKNTLFRRFRNFNQLNSSEPASNWSHRWIHFHLWMINDWLFFHRERDAFNWREFCQHVHVVKVAVTGWLRPWSLRATRLTVYSSPGLSPVCTKEVMVLGSCAVIPPSLSCQQPDTKQCVRIRPSCYCIFPMNITLLLGFGISGWKWKKKNQPVNSIICAVCYFFSFFRLCGRFSTLQPQNWVVLQKCTAVLLRYVPGHILLRRQYAVHFQRHVTHPQGAQHYFQLFLQSCCCTCAPRQQTDIRACSNILKISC